MTLLTGYFDDGMDASGAAEELQEAGFGDDLEIIDRTRLVDEYPHNLVLDGTSGQPTGVIHDETEGTEQVEDMLTVGNIQQYLEDRDVPEEEALFYARRVQDGGSLFLLEVDDDVAEQVLKVMKAHNAIVAAGD